MLKIAHETYRGIVATHYMQYVPNKGWGVGGERLLGPTLTLEVTYLKYFRFSTFEVWVTFRY